MATMDDSNECNESWDFNAPMFVDLKTAIHLQDKAEAESYFDFDHENNAPVLLDKSLEESEDFQTPKTTFTRTTRSSSKKPQKQNDEGTPQRVTRAKTPKDDERTKENIIPISQNIPMKKWSSTSKLQDVSAPKQSSNVEEPTTKKTPAVIKNQATSTDKKENKNEVLQKSGTKRQHRSLERSSSCRLAKKSKDTVPVKGITPRKGSAERKAADKVKPMTVATTPTCMKRKPIKIVNHEPIKNSEDIEMEKIEYYKQELAKKRKMAEESYKLAKQGKAPTLVSHKEITTPMEFHFETDGRIKTHGMESRLDSQVKDFASVLRSNKEKSSAQGQTKTGPTKPEPFHFTEQKKRKLPDMDSKQAEKYESMAQKLAQFNATPERFRSKPKAGAPHQRGRSRSPPSVTIPKTPQFETKTRTRPVRAPTREVLEENELEEHKKHQFKAHPVDHRIFTNPNMGVKRVPRKPTTVPEGFQLSCDKKQLKRDNGYEQERYEFHAQPFNKKILEGVVGIPEVKPILPTVPESPAFALKHRARTQPMQETEKKDEKAACLRSRAVPHFGVPFQPNYQHKITEPIPFEFEEREKAKAELKAKKMQEALEEEARLREFYANPLPDHEPHLPPKKTKPITVQQPFNLGTEVRGMKKAEEWSHKLEEELRQQKEMAKFKAREPHILETEPFVPTKSHKHTEEFSEFELNTAKRHVKREVFEMHKKKKQDDYDNIRKQEMKMKEAEEQAEVERLRQEAVHKANPIKHYKRVNVQSSQKPLTTAMSPRFKTDQRLRLRSLMSDSANSFASS